MIKHFFRIISKFKLLIPFYLIIFHCSLPDDPTKSKPENLKYDKELYTLYVGDEFKAAASVEYAVDSFTITPQLPSGLNFDKSSGLIIGKCDSSLAQTSFTVQAFNKNGSTACILKIEIFPNPLFTVQPKDNSVKINDSVSFTVKATGKSPLKYSWLKNDTIISGKDSSFLTIPAASYSDSGSYQCKVVDSLGKTALSNKAHLQIVDTGVVISPDNVPPVITRIKPQKDSASTNSTSYTIRVNCTDSSGVASVTGTMGTQIFSGTRDTGTEWTIQVSGLVVNMTNKVTITAIDNSTNGNKATHDYFIKYDPTIQDLEPPTVYFVNPIKDTIIGVDSFTITAVCKDPSGITSLTGLIDSTPFILSASSTADSIWTGTVKGLLPGAYDTIKLIATDGSAAKNKDSVSVRIKYDNDVTGPVITKITPAKDSVSTNATSYTITISCTDTSGVASVKGTLGSQSFTGIKGTTGNTWTIPVTGLVVNTVNKVVITVIDSSIKANPSTKNYYITSDPTMGDIEPPSLYFVNPAKDTIVGVDSFAITAICKDASGISTLTGIFGATTFPMSKSAAIDSIWTGTVKGLLPGVYDTIKLIATDASSAKNKDSVSVRIKYDNDVTGPVITKITPAKDSVSTNATSYTITISCADTSGIASVKGTLGSQSFTGTKGTGNTWTIAVTGLAENVFNAVVVTATDSSLRANKTVDTLYVKYDPNLDDADGPTIKQISGPASGSVISNAAIQIIDSIVDPALVDTVYWAKNNGVKKVMPLVSGTTSQYTVNDTISEGKFDTLVVTAVDKSSHHNHSTQAIILKYVKAPAISVQPVSQSVCPGTKATFSVTATGTAPLSYQWRTGATTPVNITGATSSTYEPSTTTAGQTILSCVISNESGTKAVSSPCTLTVNTASIKPTAVATPPVICSGDQSTLSVSDGDPGTGGSWKWYSNKSGTALTSLSVSPTSDSWYYIRSEGSPCGNSAWDSVLVTVNQPASKPTGTADPSSVCLGDGQKVTLSATGTVGSGGSWVWYAANKTTKITANPFTPTATATYYVRSEGATCGNGAWSNGVTVTVSQSATTPTGSASPSSVCPGDGQIVTLSVTSGNPGTNGTWVWYESDKSTKVNASFTPTVTKTYYVRSENGDCGTGAWSSGVQVTVKTQSAPPTTITLDKTLPICSGTSIKLTVSGGSLGTNANYKWYDNSGFSGTPLASGASLTVSPTSDMTYYVRVEGDCNKTSGISQTITHTTLSIPFAGQPQDITLNCPINGGDWPTFTVTPPGNANAYSYHWYYKLIDNENPNDSSSCDIDENTPLRYYSGARTSTLGCAPAGSIQIWCIVTDGCGNQVSTRRAYLIVPDCSN